MEAAKDTMLTPEEIADIVKVQPRTVRDWVKRGVLAMVKLPGGDLRIRKENFDRWLDNRIVKNR